MTQQKSASREALFRSPKGVLLWAALLLVCSLACARTSHREATVFCAASLGSFVESLELTGLATQMGGSRTLVLQVQAGAKADLLLLADEFVEDLRGFEFQSKLFAQNTLVVVTRQEQDDWTGLESFAGRLAVADPESAPLGHYTQQVLQQTEVRAQLVPLKDASAVAAAVRLGHVEAGVIYKSHLTVQDELVEATTIPRRLHDPIHYQAILFQPASPEAEKLFNWLGSEDGKATLRQAGFEV